MSLESNISRNVFQGNGTTRTFSFTFRVWKEDQVLVYARSGEEAENDVTSSCSITLSENGGTVTFPTAPAAGTTIAVTRNMPFIQEDQYITGARFDPHEIEDRLDQDCAERQQLLEKQERALVVPVTSDKTPAQVMDEILDTAARANEYAQKTEELYNEVIDIRENTETIIVEVGDEQVERVIREGDTQVARVEAEGDRQVARASAEADRAENAADIALLTHYVSGAEDTLTLQSDHPAGSVIDLPRGLEYLVGRHHLRVGYDGVIMSPSFFEEIGAEGSASTQVRILFPLYQGQELDFWIIPLGEAGEILEEVRTEGAAQIAAATEQAESAAASATAASDSANSAAVSAQAASTSAGEASSSASSASASAETASSKADAAEQSAAAAAASASLAGQQADAAAASSTTAEQKAQEASGYANNAQDSATAASSSAEEAATRAEEAQSSATVAEQKASAAASSANSAAVSAQAAQDAMTKVYRFRGSVETYDDLPTENVAIGDVYDVKLTDINYAWTGTAWDALGGRTSLVMDSQPTEGSTNAVSSGGVFNALAALQESVEAAETEAERIDSCLVTSLSNVPSNLREGGIIILQTTV